MNSGFYLQFKGFSNLLVLVGLCVFAFIGIVVYLLMHETGSAGITSPLVEDSQTEQVIVPTVDQTALTLTLPEIVERSESLECDWKLPIYDVSNPKTIGKLWTFNKKGISTINTTNNGIITQSNTLYKDKIIYTWNIATESGSKSAYKFTQTQIDDANSRMAAESRQIADQFRSQMDFKCITWTPDEAKFILPTGIYFKSP